MILIFLSAVLSVLHPIHISISEVDHNPQVKALEVTMRIFLDDLELSIRNKKNEPELDLLNPGQNRTTDQLVSEYLTEMVKIKVDKKQLPIHYLGSELDGPALICYVEVKNVKKFTTIEFTNRVIHETHSDQSNIVNVNRDDKVKSLRLTNENPTGSVSFQ